MQNKGAVRVLAIALALVCLYQLSFTWFSSRVEKKAHEYALRSVVGIEDPIAKERELKQKEKYFLDSVSAEAVYNFFWLRKYTYADCKEREINLGLDLKGGMNVMLEVSVHDVLRALSNYNADPNFVEALNRAKAMPPSEDFVSRFGRAYAEVDPNGKLASIFSTVELRDKIPFNATNEDVLNVLREEAEGAISNSEIVVRNRIDRFGVAQPIVQRLERSGRILVELPGVKDPERVRKLLQGTASLEFWETFENNEVYGALVALNNRLAELNALEKTETPQAPTSEIEPQEPTTGQLNAAPETTQDSLTSAQQTTTTTEATATTPDSVTKTDSASDDILAKLKDEKPVADSTATPTMDRAEFAKKNPLFALLTPSMTQQGELFKGPVVGLAHYRDTGAINRMLLDPRVHGLLPRDLRLLWTVKPAAWDNSQSIFQLVAIKVASRDGLPKLDGAAIAGARSEFGQQRSESEVLMWMNPEGAKVWARMTADNIGKSIAIVLDNYVYSFPTVNSEIKGGRSSITGGFTIKEAKDLVNVLQSGKLPAPARIIQEEIVGPSLGQKAIDAGVTSFLLSLIVILIFMILYYSPRAGIIADFALLCNLFFIMGVLASFQATLTLPGIAGIVLTLGMAVDANVLIFERIKEEQLKGKGIVTAVDDGFKNALSAIIDGNVTTLLTGIILGVFGSGPVRGFATTLVIGILTSMFSAIFITRLVMLRFLKHKWRLTFSLPWTKHLLQNANFNFIKARKVSYIVSGAILLIICISLIVRGFDAGIDFIGGRTYEVQFKHSVATEDVAANLEKILKERPQVKVFGESNQVKITTKYKIQDDDPNIDAEVDSLIYVGLKPMLDPSVTQNEFLEDYKLSSTKVGPTIALDIRREAVIAVILALIAIFLYIMIRFKNWRYSAGAVVGLAHDTMIVIGVYTLLWGIVPFTLEIDQAFIAAVLTIIGYSINDTVVVFDRVREFVGLYPNRKLSETFNNAINSTLSRTVATSFSTLIVLIPMVIFGGDSIRGFVFSLTVGVIVGTYSSIFISSPLAYDFGKRRRERLQEAALKAQKR